MASDATNIQAAISAIYAELAAGPLRPDYNIDGQAVSWNQYRESLLSQVTQLRQQLVAAEGPCEFETLGQV